MYSTYKDKHGNDGKKYARPLKRTEHTTLNS